MVKNMCKDSKIIDIMLAIESIVLASSGFVMDYSFARDFKINLNEKYDIHYESARCKNNYENKKVNLVQKNHRTTTTYQRECIFK